MAEQMTGGCACGRVRYTANVDDDDAYYCHCRMCQRATGSVSIAFKNLKQVDIDWARDPDWFHSSPIARRPYCRECGTSLGFAHPDSDRIDITVASFDAPGRFRPTAHFGVESMHRAWTYPPDGLNETRADEYRPLVDRWMKTVGKLPE